MPSGGATRQPRHSPSHSPRRSTTANAYRPLTRFDRGSDYDAFITAGIPTGGVNAGDEGVKTSEQAERWGGRAGAVVDPCDHSACDRAEGIHGRARADYEVSTPSYPLPKRRRRHTGELKSDRIRIGRGCALGVAAFVHYGVTMGDGAVLDADAFLMMGEEVAPGTRWREVAPGTRWRGNPAAETRPAIPSSASACDRDAA